MEEFSLYSDVAKSIIDRINSRKVDLSVGHIVITPKAYTLFFEQELSKNGGFLDIEVFSLSRLYYKLGGKPLLPDESAIMQIKRILKNARLKCFNKSKSFNGFSRRMLETIKRLNESGILPDDLDESNPKLADLKQVYAEYINQNPFSMAQILPELIKNSDYFRNCHVYVVNFDSPSRLEQRVFETIKPLCLSFCYPTVNCSLSQTLRLPKTEVYAALNRAEQIKAAARRIKKASRSGVDLSQMCLVCSLESYETACRILTEYEIDYFCDKQRRLSSNPLAQYVLSVLKGVSTRHDYIKLAQNRYVAIEPTKTAMLENYCIKFNIEYNLSKPFELGDHDEIAVVEKVRAKLSALGGRLKNCDLNRLSEFINSIEPLEGDEATKSRLKEIVSLLYNDDVDWRELFCEAVESAVLRRLPSGGGLSVCSPSTNRGKKFKLSCILDFNEGVFPSNLSELGVISAKEGASLDLSPSLEHINQRNRDDITELIYSSESVFLSYVRSPSDRPSPLIYTLTENAPITKNSSQDEWRLIENNPTDLEMLADYACCKNAGLEHLLLTLNSPSVFNSSLYSLLKEQADRMVERSQYVPKRVDSAILDSETISASRLQTFFDCPYKHFIRYGLRAKENERGGMTALDTGLLIHKASEQFFLSGFNQDKLDGIIKKSIEDFAHKLDTKTAKRLSDEIKTLCVYLKSNLECSKFQPFGAELRLSDNKLKPVKIDRALLSGSIDYADTFDGYVRVIDYKSGANVSYENKTLYYGLKLQLPLYMYALNQSGYKPAAMFYFPFRLKWNCQSYPFIGVFDNDLAVVRAMDCNLNDIELDKKNESKAIPAAVKCSADGQIKVQGSVAKTQDEFSRLTEYAFKLSELAVSQMNQGLIEPLPYKSSNKTSCHNCKFKLACGYNGSYRILKGEGIWE